MVTGTHQHQRHAVLLCARVWRRRGILASKVLPQIAHPIRHTGILEGLAVPCIQLIEVLGRQQHDTLNRIQRNGIQIIAHRHHQRAIDGNGEGHPHGKAGTAARVGGDADAAAKLLDFAVHNVETHATPRDLRHRLGRAETRREDELGHFFIAQIGVCRHHAAFDGLGTHTFNIHAGAVVADLEHDVAAFSGQIEIDMAAGRLAEGASHIGGFDAVIHRVAQHVLEGRQHAFEQRAVQLALGVVHLKLDVLTQFGRHLPDDASQAGQQAGERHHAGAHEALLKFRIGASLLQQQRFRLPRLEHQRVFEVEHI